MTPEELVTPFTTPGPNYVWGTDAGSNKDWRSDASIVNGAAPLEMEFPVPAATWTWVHNLGFRPIVQVYNTARELMLAYVDNSNANQISVTHLYNETGWIVIR